MFSILYVLCKETFVSKNTNALETKLLCAITDSTNHQVNVPCRPIITSKNNNDARVTNNDIQFHVEKYNNHLDDEDLLIDYKASEDDESSCIEMMDNISRDLDVYSTSPVRNYNTFDLTPNPLNEEASSSTGIHVDAILVLCNSVKKRMV